METGIGFVPFGGAAFEIFQRINKDDRTPVRVAAAKELGADRDPKIAEALAKACSDKQWRVRAAVLVAIARRNDPALLPAVTRLLNDRNGIVRDEAAATVLRLSAVKTAE